MVSAANAFIVLLPPTTIVCLMVRRYWPATRTMPVTWVVVIRTGILGWDVMPQWAITSTTNGFTTALSILHIVFGAILFLYTLK